jgi:hypothetical protein
MTKRAGKGALPVPKRGPDGRYLPKKKASTRPSHSTPKRPSHTKREVRKPAPIPKKKRAVVRIPVKRKKVVPSPPKRKRAIRKKETTRKIRRKAKKAVRGKLEIKYQRALAAIRREKEARRRAEEALRKQRGKRKKPAAKKKREKTPKEKRRREQERARRKRTVKKKIKAVIEHVEANEFESAEEMIDNDFARYVYNALWNAENWDAEARRIASESGLTLREVYSLGFSPSFSDFAA